MDKTSQGSLRNIFRAEENKNSLDSHVYCFTLPAKNSVQTTLNTSVTAVVQCNIKDHPSQIHDNMLVNVFVCVSVHEDLHVVFTFLLL